MAEAMAEALAEAKAELEARDSVPKIGLPEVDRIIDGCKLKTFPTHCLIAPADKVRSIRKFREVAALAARRNITPPLPNLDNMDRISRLPDEILKSIISHLAMRQAAATSVLSPRWRNLWTTSLSSLNFDIPNMLGHDYPNAVFKKKTQDYITRKRAKFTKWVNHVSNQFFCQESLSLDALRISFILNKDSTPDIDTWIISSVARGVTDIHLEFDYDKFHGHTHNPYKIYVFPAQQVASTIRYLHLKFCKLNLPPDFTGFTSLVSLSLYCVYITPALMEDIILSKCPLLEFLSVDECLHPGNSTFKFAGTSLRLKHLHITAHYNITNIEVHNINLLSFELIWNLPKLSIKNAPHLARLVLLTLTPIDFVRNTPRLETLFLRQYDEKTCSVPETNVLNNLKRLVFISQRTTTNLLGVANILEACHLLQTLELDMGIAEGDVTMSTEIRETVEKLTALPGFPLNSLKEIDIYGFDGDPEKVAFVEYLLNNAVVLQKMKLCTTSKSYFGNGRWKPRKKKQAKSLEEISKCGALINQG